MKSVTIILFLFISANVSASEQNTFKSRKFGFTVDYPKNWDVEPDQTGRLDGTDVLDAPLLEFAASKCDQKSDACWINVDLIFPSLKVKSFADFKAKIAVDRKWMIERKDEYKVYDISAYGRDDVLIIQNNSGADKTRTKILSKYRINCGSKNVFEIKSSKELAGKFSDNFQTVQNDIVQKALENAASKFVSSFKCIEEKK